MDRIGELAAFGTAVSWTIGALFFERGIKRIGVLSVNFFKVVFGFILLTITAVFIRGIPLPFDAPPRVVLFLSLSSISGFVIADMFLLSAYATVGPRIGMLFMALSPPITAGIAYVFLGETIGSRGGIGMCLVLTGIFMTMFGRQNGISLFRIKKDDKRGYLFAFIASLGQSAGVTLTRAGIGDYHPVSATQIRLLTAIIGFGIVSLLYTREKTCRKR